jgi:hypothetical protein
MKDCCNIKVTETEKGYRIEVTGEKIKEKCGAFIENCCSDENIKKCFEACCGSKE